MKRSNKRRICLGISLAAIILLLLCEIVGSLGFFESVFYPVFESVETSLTRALGGAAFLSMLVYLGYKVLCPMRRYEKGAMLLIIPAFIIAINNFPFSTVIRGDAEIHAEWWAIALLLLECVCVAFFEEMAFRGVVFLGLLKRDPQNRLWAFVSILISSVVFGLIHLVNIFASSPVAVIMQIGYSALIGAMCAVLLMASANIWLCVIVHALFNFLGALVPRCGSGVIWDTFTVVLTVVVSIAVAIWYVVVFVKGKFDAVQGIYEK